MRKNKYAILSIALVIILLSSCATPVDVSECVSEKYGFLSGIWHGITAAISIIGSIFWDIAIYAKNNTGFFYDLGFMIGITGAVGSIIKLLFALLFTIVEIILNFFK